MGVFHLCGLFKSRGSWAGAKRSHCNARTAHLLGNGFAEAAYKFLIGIESDILVFPVMLHN